jgi:hypothetical protein
LDIYACFLISESWFILITVWFLENKVMLSPNIERNCCYTDLLIGVPHFSPLPLLYDGFLSMNFALMDITNPIS